MVTLAEVANRLPQSTQTRMVRCHQNPAVGSCGHGIRQSLYAEGRWGSFDVQVQGSKNRFYSKLINRTEEHVGTGSLNSAPTSSHDEMMHTSGHARGTTHTNTQITHGKYMTHLR